MTHQPTTSKRLLIALLGLAVCAGSAWWLERNTDPVLGVATGMLGESWYGIELGAAHVGFMYTHNHRDLQGRWHFRTVTHFQLEAGQPQTIDKHLIFAARPPHRLQDARYQNRYGTEANSGSVSVRVMDHGSGQNAVIDRSGRTNRTELNWDFTLHHFLDFEFWLQGTEPPDGSTHVAQNPDFEQLRIDKRSYRVLERNPEGYLISANAPLAPTTTQLDARYRPLSLTMSGVFNVSRMPRERAVALNNLPHRSSYLFPLDQRIEDHLRTTRLRLRVHNAPTGSLPDELHIDTRSRKPVADPERFQGEALNYPITDTQVQTLAQRALANPGEDVIKRLVEITHGRLNYVQDQPAGSVAAALRKGSGECTDFADLFTTLARAAGFTARTVYGLAYRDGPEPAFMFHAWNEIADNGRWRAVDPTWNQADADATHIQLEPGIAAQMMLAANTTSVSFDVLAVHY